jgi:hypothetical protein
LTHTFASTPRVLALKFCLAPFVEAVRFVCKEGDDDDDEVVHWRALPAKMENFLRDGSFVRSNAHRCSRPRVHLALSRGRSNRFVNMHGILRTQAILLMPTASDRIARLFIEVMWRSNPRPNRDRRIRAQARARATVQLPFISHTTFQKRLPQCGFTGW